MYVNMDKNLTKRHLKKQRILTDDEDLVAKRRNASYLARQTGNQD